MTKEQQIDWLCRLKSEIKIFMPYQWQKPFEEALDMAIKAPEQEPKEITLEDVKGYCEPRCLTIISNELYYELTHPKIKALEQEPSKWVSVSERLPEDGKYVLACDMYKEMIIGTIYKDNCGDSNTNYAAEDENGCVMYDVVAWMPLPEPYKAESEDEKA